ncbi:uncharacterized protein LOC106632637 [Haplochromis burtoni]|uniref:uncharacterized protein LOC106632637 n=1 Tax=Haplochromis burtoni TaxID=8153 RepID=UPI001C2DE2ED|nr:uncharacterized protein LOC106632637 [Haplochromis burtoni]
MASVDVMNPHYGWGLKKNPHLLKEYTEKYVGKSLHHPSASLSTAKPGSAEQVVRKVLLTKAMCEIFVILANGQRCSMLLSAIQLQEMIVSIFKEEVKKMLIKKGYNKDNIKLLYDGKPLDDDSAPVKKYGIKAGSTVQMTDNLERSQVPRLNMENCKLGIILPDGRRVSMMLCPGQLQRMTVSQFKEDILRVWAIHGYTEKHVTLQVEGKTLDNPSALLADCGIKAGSTVQMLLEVFIILPDGRRHVMPLSAKQLQEMTVSLLEEEVLKMLMMKTVVGYTKDVLKLHIDGMPLDNGFVLKIKAGKKVQAVIMVHGG